MWQSLQGFVILTAMFGLFGMIISARLMKLIDQIETSNSYIN